MYTRTLSSNGNIVYIRYSHLTLQKIPIPSAVARNHRNKALLLFAHSRASHIRVSAIPQFQPPSLAIMQSMLSFVLLLLTNKIASYLIPNPPGKYNVTLTIGTLIDYTRNVSSATTSIPRTVMLSVFQPAICASTIPVPYMPNETAEYQGLFLQTQFNISANFTPLFLEAQLSVCPKNCSSQEGFPILLLSPGYGIPRLYYSVVASALASEGFTVMSIDHPEDANIITYPDGHAVYNNGPRSPTADEYVPYVYSRVADVSFIIDQLSNATAMSELLPHRGLRPFATGRVAMLGHSLGGVAAVIAAGQEPRLRAAINWDGTLFGSLPSGGLNQPVLLVSEETQRIPVG
jgi:hypothetical protein